MPAQEKIERALSMQGLYVESERQFAEFTNIIPLKANPLELYSPRLWGILLSVGSQIDGLLKLLTEEFNLHVNSEKFPAQCQALNSGGMLSAQKITLRDKFAPFNPFEEETRGWWEAYNATKHDLPEGIYKATLGNTIQALGALFILNHIGNILLMRTFPGSNVARDPVERVLRKVSWQVFEEEFRKAPDDPKGVTIGNLEISPRLIADLQPFRWGSHEWHSTVFYHLSIYWPVWGEIRLLKGVP